MRRFKGRNNTFFSCKQLECVQRFFVGGGHVDWVPALLLAVGFACGGAVGARFTVVSGARVVRPVMTIAVLAFSGRLLGLY